jgi:hypothetical protein
MRDNYRLLDFGEATLLPVRAMRFRICSILLSCWKDILLCS